MESIIVTEPVYEKLGDGRTVLAAAIGDELTPDQAERLKVGKDGTSSNGVKPATKLETSDEVQQPGAAGEPVDAAGAGSGKGGKRKGGKRKKSEPAAAEPAAAGEAKDEA